MSNHHKITNSSSIEHIDYYDDKDTLEIKFSSGSTYHYPNCHKQHYTNLKNAESAGRYFHSSIRDAHRAIKVK